MKKRLVDGEIETAKKTSRIMVTVVTIILILLIIVVAYVAYLYEAGKLFTNEKGEIVIKNEPKVNNIDITDTNILDLLNTVKVTNTSCEDSEYSKDKITVESLSTKCKYAIAKNKYKDYIKYDSNNHITYVEEEKVKKVYQSLFGNNTYERQEVIPYVSLHDLMFDARYNYYFMNDSAEEQEGSFKNYEKISSAEKKNNDLYITSIVLYYETVNRVICKDNRCEKVIEVLSKEQDYNDDYFDLYLEHHKDKLDKYKYHFTLNSLGFYEYKGYERTSS